MIEVIKVKTIRRYLIINFIDIPKVFKSSTSFLNNPPITITELSFTFYCSPLKAYIWSGEDNPLFGWQVKRKLRHCWYPTNSDNKVLPFFYEAFQKFNDAEKETFNNWLDIYAPELKDKFLLYILQQ